MIPALIRLKQMKGSFMNSLEDIHLRITKGTRNEVLDILYAELAPKIVRGPDQTNIYCHAVFETDINVHLLWSVTIPPHGSTMGLQIAAGLRELGIVKHMVWYTAFICSSNLPKGDRHVT
jgi:hypothetical protein